MSIIAAQLIAKVGVDGADKAKSDLQSVGGAATSAGGIFKSALGGGISLAAGLAGKAFSFLKGQLEDSVKLAMAHQDVMAQTAQAIKSTGDASGLSAGQIGDMATALSKVTPFSEDTIQSGQNLLLTFTGIGKQVFPQATQAMLDLSQATGQDMSSSAMQLGKALNDPLTGMAALQRVGVTFSASEKEQIKTMMAHNDVIGAQKVMLKELNTEFGGSAQAAGKTLAGALAILKNNFDDLKEKVGSAVIPIFSNLVGMLNTDVLPLFDKLGPIIGDVVRYFKLFDLTPIAYTWRQLTDAIRGALAPLTGTGDAMKKLSPLLVEVRNGFSQLLVAGIRDVSKVIEAIATSINKLTGNNASVTALSGVSEAFHQVGEAASKAGPAVNFLGDIARHTMEMNKAITTLVATGNKGKGFFTDLSSAFKEFAPLIQHVGDLMGGELMREFRDLISLAQEIGRWFTSSVVPALRQAEPGFANLAKTVLTTVIPAIIQIRGVIVDVIEHAFKIFGPIIERIVPPLIRFAGLLANDVANGLKIVTPYVIQAAKEIGKFADDIMTRVAPIITKFLDDLKTGLDFFKAHWSQIWGVVGPILKGVWDTIVGIVKTAWSLVSGIVLVGLDVLSGNWKGAWDDLKNALSGAWSGIQNIISGGLEIINGMFGGLPGKALQWGENLISSFIQGIQNMLGGVGQAAQNVMATVESYIGVHSPTKLGPGRTLDQWGINLVKQFTNDIRSKTPEARLAAEDMMRQIQTAIAGATTQLNMAKLSGNVAGQLAAKNTLFDLNAQMSQYQNVVKSAGYSYNAKDTASPIGFGGQTMDQMVALAGVNKFTKDIASTTTGAHKDAQSLFSNLLKSLDGFAQKIAMAQLSGNTDLVNKLQAQQTTQQTQLSLFEMLAGKKGLTLDESNMNSPITSFAQTQNTAVAPSSVQYQFLGSRNQQTAPMVVQVQPNHIYLDGRMVATSLMPHIANAIRYGIATTGV